MQSFGFCGLGLLGFGFHFPCGFLQNKSQLIREKYVKKRCVRNESDLLCSITYF